MSVGAQTNSGEQMSPADALDAQIASWSGYLRRRRAVAGPDVDELEQHLRDQIDGLRSAGLADDEAFIVAIKRMGSVDELSREYAREHSDRLWKQLVIEELPRTAGRGKQLAVVLALAVGAGLAVKLPELLGLSSSANPDFWVLNLGLLVLPFLAAFFAWSRRLGAATIATVVGAFAATALILNLYPFTLTGMTMPLAAGHAIIVLWLAVGLAYAGGAWRSDASRMDFIRFTGEWVVYYVLIALGGGVLVGLTMAVFSAVGVDVAPVVFGWLVPCGAAGAVVVAAALVEAKQSVIENIAPVLTKLFTPLFTAMLLALIVAAVIQANFLLAGRDLLIIFDAVLVVVLGLLLYSISARDPQAKVGWFERLQLVMVSSALVVDALVLAAMLARIGAFGFSANKVASLGLNVILLVNLAWSAWLLVRILRGTARPATLERWQTRYLPVYLVWALVVMIVFPPVFGFA